VNAQQASELAGIALSHDGIWFASGGWLSPFSFCEGLALHPNIQIKTSLDAMQLEYLDAQWKISNVSGTVENADAVVLCNANDVTQFSQTAHLPLSSVRGQVSLLAPNSASLALNCVVCTEGYITPSYQNRHCLGASFSPDEVSMEVRAEDHQANLALLKQISPALAETFEVQALQGRVALRSRSPDYLPLVGEILNAQTLSENTTPAFRIKADELDRHQGLYVNVGHGSKGMITAPLCAELLASHMNGAPLPMAVSLAKSLDPNRFILKSHELKRLIGADFE
jgi:tRNA 5-methylaminomethyl-2-thiouridine biosynthesis bifunctional protein